MKISPYDPRTFDRQLKLLIRLADHVMASDQASRYCEQLRTTPAQVAVTTGYMQALLNHRKKEKDLPSPIELGNTYCDDKERFVVSLLVTSGRKEDGVTSPLMAVKCALDLMTEDDAQGDTQWYVFDRHTHKLHMIEQKETGIWLSGVTS